MWRPDPPEKVEHLDVDTDGRSDGEALLWDAATSGHVYGAAAVEASQVRDAGIWEVIVSGTSPPVAATNEAEDDWVYGWVAD